MPGTVGVPVTRIVSLAHVAETPWGSPLAVPIPVAPLVQKNWDASCVLAHTVGDEAGVLTLLGTATFRVSIATAVQPLLSERV